MGNSFLSPEEISALVSRLNLPEDEQQTLEDATDAAQEWRQDEAYVGWTAETKKVVFAKLEENNSVRKDYKTEEFAHINFPLQLVLGETILTVKELLDLKEDSIIVLDRLAADSATLLLNGRPLAEGEIVVFNDCFAFRINSLGENGLKNSNSKEEEQGD